MTAAGPKTLWAPPESSAHGAYPWRARIGPLRQEIDGGEAVRRRRGFADRRRVVGLSQEQLARVLGVERSTIVRWEAGSTLPRPWLRPHVAKVLQLSLEELDHLLATDSLPDGRHRQSRTTCTDDDAQECAEFAEFLAGRDSVSARQEALHDETMQLATRYLRLPLSVVGPQIRSARQTAFGWLREGRPAGNTSDLLMVAGWLCGLSAHVRIDAGDYAGASVHVRTARACAEAAGHADVQAWTWSLESLIAYWSGDHGRAKQAALSGLASASLAVSVCRLASLQARAAAAQGDVDTADRALRHAESVRHGGDDRDPLPGLLGFPEAKYFAYAGTTTISLGAARAADAAALSRTALDLYRSGGVEDVSRNDVLAARLDLAKAAVFVHDVVEVEHNLGQVAAGATGGLSASLLTRLRDLDRLALTTGLAPQAARNVHDLTRDALGCARAATGPSVQGVR